MTTNIVPEKSESVKPKPANTNEVKSDPAAALNFMKSLRPQGPWLIGIIDPETGRIDCGLFDPAKEYELTGLVTNTHQKEKHNVYFHLNVTPDGFAKRAKEKDIVACPWLHVDIDPEEGKDADDERARILDILNNPPAGVPLPTVIINSGNGFQGLWKLDKPLSPDEAKARNKWLEKKLGGDACHNVDRLLRLPGTINWPNEKKKKKGRVAASASLIAWDEDRVYGADRFERAALDKPTPKAKNKKGNGKSRPSIEHKPLPKDVDLDALNIPGQLKALIRDGDTEGQFKSRSELVYHVVCELSDYRIADEVVVSVLCDPQFEVSDRILERNNPEDFAWDEVARIKPQSSRVRLERIRNQEIVVDGNVIRVADWERDEGIPQDVPDTVSVENRERRPFKLRSEAEQDNQPDIEWLIPGVLQRETLALFYGVENSFKSFLVLDLMLSASAAISWASYEGQDALRGFRADKPLTVIYYAGEGARGIEKRRRPVWRKHHNITKSLAFYTVNEMPIFKSADDVKEMIREIREAGIVPDIIAIDTAARAMLDLDENSAKDTGIFIASCDRLKREFGCAVIAVHHSGKDDRKGARGSTNLPASFDTRFKVTGDTDTLMATIKNEKQKDGEPWSSVIVFQGEQVTLDDGRRSLVFGRVPSSAKSMSLDDEKRITEVRAALVTIDGSEKIISTGVLAHTIVYRRLGEDPSVAAKAEQIDVDRMERSERRKLQRQAKDKNGKPGILRQFVAGDLSDDISWTLPMDTNE